MKVPTGFNDVKLQREVKCVFFRCTGFFRCRHTQNHVNDANTVITSKKTALEVLQNPFFT
jgi:hypothetical protein